jgi:hypothetical protein
MSFEKKTTKEFIKLAKTRHGNKYDYSKAIYDGYNTKVTVICKKHGKFYPTPKNHTKSIKPTGCHACGYEKNSKARRFTLDMFKQKAVDIHGDKYSYDKVIYNGADTKVIINCPLHGDFLQSPYHHINRKSGCLECSYIKKSENNRMTTKEFIKKAKKKYNGNFTYENTNYVDQFTKVTITCPLHGDFSQNPRVHLKIGCLGGCKKCAHIKIGDARRHTMEDFLKKSYELHGDTYLYDDVYYIDTMTSIEITCRIHGNFTQVPTKHLSGHGCKKCGFTKIGASKVSTLEEFIEKANRIHLNKYSYKKTKYVNSKKLLTITCKKHGDFLQIPSNHLKGGGCQDCANDRISEFRLSNREDFILKAKKIHGDIYEYKNVVYAGCYELVNITCKNHGSYLQTPAKHVTGSGCPFCVKKTEGKLLKWLGDNNFTVEYSKRFDWCKNKKCLPFDFYIPNLNLILELDGNQHFFQVKNWISPKETQMIDKYKMECANKNGMSVIRIYQPDVWLDKNDWKTNLLNAIKKYNNNTNIFIGDIYTQYYSYGIIKGYKYNIFKKNIKKLSVLDMISMICDNICKCIVRSKKLCEYLVSLNLDLDNFKSNDTEIFYSEIAKICDIMVMNSDSFKNILSLMIE